MKPSPLVEVSSAWSGVSGAGLARWASIVLRSSLCRPTSRRGFAAAGRHASASLEDRPSADSRRRHSNAADYFEQASRRSACSVLPHLSTTATSFLMAPKIGGHVERRSSLPEYLRELHAREVRRRESMSAWPRICRPRCSSGEWANGARAIPNVGGASAAIFFPWLA